MFAPIHPRAFRPSLACLLTVILILSPALAFARNETDAKVVLPPSAWGFTFDPLKLFGMAIGLGTTYLDTSPPAMVNTLALTLGVSPLAQSLWLYRSPGVPLDPDSPDFARAAWPGCGINWGAAWNIGLLRDPGRIDRLNLLELCLAYQGSVTLDYPLSPDLPWYFLNPDHAQGPRWLHTLGLSLNYDDRARQRASASVDGLRARAGLEWAPAWLGNNVNDPADYLRLDGLLEYSGTLYHDTNLTWGGTAYLAGDMAWGTVPLAATFPANTSILRGNSPSPAMARALGRLESRWLFPRAMDPGMVPGLLLCADGALYDGTPVATLGGGLTMRLDSASILPFSNLMDLNFLALWNPARQRASFNFDMRML